MESGFHNRRDWWTVGLAMAVWAVHFTLVWAASVVFPGDPAARWIALGLTIAAAVALVVLALRARVRSPFSTAGLGVGIAAAAIAFDVLPALLG